MMNSSKRRLILKHVIGAAVSLLLLGLVLAGTMVVYYNYSLTQRWYKYCQQQFLRGAQGYGVDVRVCDQIAACMIYQPIPFHGIYSICTPKY